MFEPHFAESALAAAEVDLATAGCAAVQARLRYPFFRERFEYGCDVRLVVVEIGDGEVEWYLPGDIHYFGATKEWLEIMAAPLLLGGRLFWRGTDGLRESAASLEAELVAEETVALQRLSVRWFPKREGGAVPMKNRISAARADSDALFERLRTNVLGQDSVLRPLCDLVTRHRYRATKRRPVVACLVGPTGVGKTAAAEQLAESLAQLHARESWHFARIDCGSMTEPHTVSRLVGAPSGYVGHGTTRALSDVVAAQPRTIVLLDEIEKATPAIYPVLLSILDQGRIPRMDSPDAAVDATQCVILWTSNIAAESLVKALDLAKAWDDPVARLTIVRQAMAVGGLRPELIGRVQQALPFRPLSDELRAQIAHKAIVRLGADFGVTVESVDTEVVAAVLDRTLDARWGARPDENSALELLGDVFLEVDEGAAPVAVVAGPPIQCVPQSERSVR